MLLIFTLPVFAQRPFAAVKKRLLERPTSGRAWRALREVEERGEAIRLAQATLKTHPQHFFGWRILGELAVRADDYPLALAAFERSAKLASQQGKARDESRALVRMWRLYRDLGLDDEGYEVLQRLRKAYVKAGLKLRTIDRLLRNSEEEKSLAHLDVEERYRRIVQATREAKDLPGERDALAKLAHHLYYRATVEAFREAMEARRRVLEIDDLIDMKDPLILGQDHNAFARMGFEYGVRLPEGKRRREVLSEALAAAERALELHRERGGRELLRDHCVLAHIHQALGNGEEAKKHFEYEREQVMAQRAKVSTVRSSEGLGARSLRAYDGEVHHIYEDYGLFLASGRLGTKRDVEAALRTTEAGRVASLRELYAVRGRTSPDWLDRKVGLPDLQTRLAAADTALVVFLVGSHEVGGVVVTGKGAHFAPLGTRDALDALAKRFASGVLNLRTPRKEIEALGSEAFQGFLAPFWSHCGDARRLVFVGLGRFGTLPLAALVTPGKKKLEQRYLGARLQVARSPSIGCLFGTGVRRAKGSNLCIGHDGRAKYRDNLGLWPKGQAPAPLAQATSEARQVAEHLKAKLLLQEAAGESALVERASEAPIIHFACHAILDPERAARTALLIAPDESGDGLFNLSEVLGLDLGARLVILSACSSAQGKAYDGEGLRGLSRSFFVAGARFVLASIAPLEDGVAPRFLDAFTAKLAEGTNLSEALLSARRAMLKKRFSAHPALWAPFVLHGQDAELLR